MPVRVEIPPGLDGQRALGPDWADWLDRLPRITAEILEEWGLSREDDVAWHGYCSLVLPVRTSSGRPAAVKLTFDGDDESLHESLALQHWQGAGTVRMLRADPSRRAMLLERLRRVDLRSVDDDLACEIVAGFYQRLHVPAPPQLRTVTSYVERWLDDLAALPREAPVPRRYAEQALSLGRDLIADPASTGKMVHGDLHHENVLAADREPWLVIDPKPMSGDPHYEPEPMLRNNWEFVVETGNVRETVRRRFFTLVDVAELDEDRVRAWAIVRLVLNISWSILDAQRADRALDEDDREWITTLLTVAKAIQD
jgi:streptomycin 6-kinase